MPDQVPLPSRPRPPASREPPTLEHQASGTASRTGRVARQNRAGPSEHPAAHHKPPKPSNGRRTVQPRMQARVLQPAAVPHRPRYPNYLPQMHVVRARNQGLPSDGMPAWGINDLSVALDRAVLNNLLRISDTRGQVFGMQPGQGSRPMLLKPMTMRKSLSMHSIYRADPAKVAEWGIGTPTIQVGYLRSGQGVGPRPSQLPSPESSHSTRLSIRGHHHHEQWLARRDYPSTDP